MSGPITLEALLHGQPEAWQHIAGAAVSDVEIGPAPAPGHWPVAVQDGGAHARLWLVEVTPALAPLLTDGNLSLAPTRHGHDGHTLLLWQRAAPAAWHADHLPTLLTHLADHHARYWQASGLDALPSALDADLLAAAQPGVARMQALAGWPGVLPEDQVAVMAGLLDDPEAWLAPLRRLPDTLLNGQPWPEHWQAGDPPALWRWDAAARGPAVLDVAALLMRYSLRQDGTTLETRDWVLDEDALMTHYLSRLNEGLGQALDEAAFRAALPAARLHHVLTHWLPQFDGYFARLKPTRAIWRTFARFPPSMIERLGLAPLIDNRAWFARLFDQFADDARAALAAR